MMLVHVDFRSGETLSSFLSRTAAANGSGNAEALVGHLGKSLNFVLEGGSALPDDFSVLLGVAPERLEKARRHRLEKHLHEVDGHKLSRRSMLQGCMRYCTKCLVNDMAAFLGPPTIRPFGRMSWTNADAFVCPLHHVELEECENELEGPQDFTTWVSSRWREINMLAERAKPVPMHSADEYFAKRLDDDLSAPTFLDTVPFYVAENLCIHTGALRTIGAKARTSMLLREELALLRRNGFEVLSAGESSFRDFLYEIAARYWKTAAWHPASGLFGSLYRYLYHHLDDAHASVIEVVQDVVVNALPLGRGDKFLGELPRRRLHTVATVARQYGTKKSKVRELLAAKGLISERHQPADDFVHVMNADAVEAELKGEVGLLYLSKLQRNFQMHDLRHTCVFDPTWRYALRPRRNATQKNAMYCPYEAVDLLEKMTRNASANAGVDMVTLRNGSRLALCTMTELLTQLVEGGLSKVSFHEAQKFGGVRVSYLELREKRTTPYPGYLHYEDVALLSQLPVALARTLIEREMIPATWIPLAELPRTYRMVLPKMFERFHSENVSVFALAKNMGLAKRSVVAKLTEAGIKPSISLNDQEPVFYFRHEASA